jgi:hypothetical protein
VPSHKDPPPETLAALVPVVALVATATGTFTWTVVPAAIGLDSPQLARLVAPLAGQPLKVTPLAGATTLGAPNKVMPLGRLSFRLIAEIVAALVTATLIV